MPQICSVCRHSDREAVEQATIEGEPLRAIARQFQLSKDAIARHKAEHLPKTLVKAQAAHEVVRADSLLDCLQQRRNGLDQLDEDAREIQEEARRDRGRHGALEAIKARTGIARAQTGVDQLFANFTGQLGTPSPQNVLIQVLALPKIGETLEGFHRAIECHSVPELPTA